MVPKEPLVDDVVGIKVRDAQRGWVGLITWGRLWDAVDDTELLQVVGKHLHTFGIEHPEELAVCPSLRDLQSVEYFYEGILSFSWKPPPVGTKQRSEWQNKMREELRTGRGIYFIGALSGPTERSR